eukprot:scaffold21180_cov31-Tisochrysis_lutea.AAC.5
MKHGKDEGGPAAHACAVQIFIPALATAPTSYWRLSATLLRCTLLLAMHFACSRLLHLPPPIPLVCETFMYVLFNAWLHTHTRPPCAIPSA